MEKLQVLMKIISALPTIVSNIERITEDRFISLHEVLCAIEDTVKAFGLNPEKVGILITKDGDIHLVFKGILHDINQDKQSR